MKRFALLLLLVARTVSAQSWTISNSRGDQFALDVTRTSTGYRAAVHQDSRLWSEEYYYNCPGLGQVHAGQTLLNITRQNDGTFAVKILIARIVPAGPNGIGVDPITSCFTEPFSYVGRIVDRRAASAIDPAQVSRYPRDHDTFMDLYNVSSVCPIPEERKYTCGGPWPVRPIIDMPLVDTDGDGLFDEWEIGGIRDGAQWLDLKSMGADPDHKDLFIQMDASPETAYEPNTLTEAAIIMNSMPIRNPAGRNGIHLHIDAGPSSMMNPVTSASWGSLSRAETNLLAPGHFSGWANGDPCGNTLPIEAPMLDLYNRHLEPLRKKAFRYVAVVKYFGPSNNCITGMNWTIRSKYFVIADYGPHGKLSNYAMLGTPLHELGHSLGLRHAGGRDEPNYNPAYQSVMNYSYQIYGISRVGETEPPGDYLYSSDASPSNAIDETQLSERTGFPSVGLPGRQLNFKCSTGLFGGTPGRRTDFDCDNAVTTPAPIDITPSNGMGPTTLFPYNDVANMILPLETGSSGNGAGASSGETLRIGDALRDGARLLNDREDPTVRLTLRQEKGKRFVVIAAHDDVGLATATISFGGKTRVVSLSTFKKLSRDVTQSVEVDPAGDVTVTIVDLVDKSATATIK